MGEVYRARDTRLRREVAVRVLPEAFASDPDRLRRFEQEALATAALNHPNILAVYDIGREGESTFVVAELLDGMTLRKRLEAALPVRRVVDYAVQIANGLAAAHDRGIVHRDLKPENVFVTRDDRIKILDFGLARVVPVPTADTTTGLAAATEPGVVMGTAGYMAPEQVRGQPVDHRADLFSFGAVIYEMLTGRRAFDGGTTADTMTAILKEMPPEPASLGRAVPPALERVVVRCLEKSPAARFQSASDLSFALQALSGDLGAGSGATRAIRSSGMALGRPPWLALAAALIAGIGLGAVGLGLWGREVGGPVVGEPIRFNVSAADGFRMDDLIRAVVSPDGQFLALSEQAAGGRRLTVRSLRDGTRRDLGVELLGHVNWSPDSRALVYFGSDRALRRISVTGTDRQRLAPLAWSPAAVNWTRRGDIVTVIGSGAMLVVPATGGTPREVLRPSGDVNPWGFVHMLPDGNRFVLSRQTGAESEILLETLDGSRPEQVVARGRYAQFAEPGYLLALRDNQLVVWRTDLSELPTGEPEVLLDSVLVRLGVSIAPFSASSTVVAFRTEDQELRTRLAWFDRAGREGATLALRGHCRNPEFSPDYDRVAVECWDRTGGRDIWVYDLARDLPVRLTTDPADDSDPVWTRDGRSLFFASARQGPSDVYQVGAGGGRAEELVVRTPGSTPTMGLSPDGRQLMLLTSGVDEGGSSTTGLDLSLYQIGGPDMLVPILDSPSAEIEGQFSPDGRFMLYASNQSGRYDVYAEPWPRTGDRWAISTEGGTDARWRPDGQEIFYLSPDRRLMAVPVRTAGGFSAGRPVPLFQTRVAGPLGTGHRFPFAVSRDGQRFLMYVTDPDGPPPAISVIVNWQALLRKR